MDLTGAEWRKSRRSSGNGGDCVEVAAVGRRVAVRDSKARTGPVLAYSGRDWGAFVAGIRAGRYDIR